MDHCPSGSSVHGILQARILEAVAMPSSRASSQPRDWTRVSYVSCISRRVLYHQCHLGSPRYRLTLGKYNPNLPKSQRKDPSQNLRLHLVNFPWRTAGPWVAWPFGPQRLQTSFFSLRPPTLFSLFFFIAELFNTLFKDMPGCLLEIQSCHGNVACFSKLGHIPSAFFFFNVVCFLSHTTPLHL